VIGRYQIVDRLNEGGMGTLYLARDPSLDRLVVIKVLRSGFQDPEVHERFTREARSISRLRHPNIVTIFEYGEFQGQPFIAMEYVAGESMAELIQRRAALSLPRKLQMIEELCAGMAYAHRSRIVHRDLKPANIMIDAEGGLIKILDFGIARDLEASFSRFTQMIGTPSYMSPEQANGSRIDHRSDIFSIGVVFYELLSYKRAFDGESHFVILQRVQSEDPPSLGELAPSLDSAVVRIVERALEKNPENRYQDLETMRAQVTAARERIAHSASEPTVILSPRAEPAPPSATPPLRSLERRRADLIKQHLEAADQALAARNFDLAVESCEQVLLLDQAHARALALIDTARTAIDQATIDRFLAQARDRLDANDLTGAETAIVEALKVRSTEPAALALQREVAQARRVRELAAERAASAEAALARARKSFADGAFESAIRAASEALAYLPDLAEAGQLKQLASAALQQRLAQDELERRARETIRAADALFSAGNHARAIELLNRFTPPIDVVSDAIAELTGRVAAIARQRALEEEERRRRELEERRRQEEIERQREKDARIRALTARAEHLAARDDLDAADGAISEIEAVDASASPIERLRKLVATRRTALDAEAERQRRFDERLQKGVTLVGQQQFEAALIELDRALDWYPSNAEAQRLRQLVLRTIEERRRAVELEQQTRSSVEDARRRFSEGDHDGALASLEQLDTNHPAVADALRELKVLAEAARQRADEQRRAKEEADRLERRQRWATDRMSQARQAHAAMRFDDALRLLDEVAGTVPDVSGLDDLRAAILAARTAQQEAEKRRAEIGRHLDLSRRHFNGRDWPAAIAEVEAALRLDVNDPAAALLRQQIVEAHAAEQRAAEAAERDRLQRIAEQRAAEAAERERRIAEQRAAEAAERDRLQRIAEQRAAEAAARERRIAEQRAAEAAERDRLQRIAEQRAAEAAERERRIAEQRAAEAAERDRLQRIAEQRAAEAAARDAARKRPERQASEVATRSELVANQRGTAAHRAPDPAALAPGRRPLLSPLGRKAAAAATIVVIATVVTTIGVFHWAGGPTVPEIHTGSAQTPQSAPQPTTSDPAPGPVSSPVSGQANAQPSGAPSPQTSAGTSSSPAHPPERQPTPSQPGTGAGRSQRADPGSGVTTPPKPSDLPGSAAPPIDVVTLTPSQLPEPGGPGSQRSAGGELPTGNGGTNTGGPAGPAPQNPLPDTSPLHRFDDQAERASIQQLLLDQWVSAYSRMDEDRLRQLDPSFKGIPQKSLLSSVEVRLSDVKIEFAADGQTARLQATETFSYRWKRAQLAPTSSGPLNWTLRKAGNTWSVSR
jgi:serine/threonine-protein kinase